MKKEEFQHFFDALQDLDFLFFEDFMFLCNDEGDVDFFEFRMSFNSASAIEKFFDVWKKSLKYEEFQRGERERIYGSFCYD